MALTSQARTGCPASDEAPFATLGDVDRLGTAFCAEPHASELLAGVQGYRTFRMQCLATTLRILHACRPPTRSVVSLRLKRLDSIRRKITRPGANFKLGTLDDVIGVRVICRSVSDVVALSARLKSSPHIHRVKDYIEAPASTGYRAIHHIMRLRQPVSAERSLGGPVRDSSQNIPPTPLGRLVRSAWREGEDRSSGRRPPRTTSSRVAGHHPMGRGQPHTPSA